MTTAMAQASGKALERNAYVTQALALMANSCMMMIKSNKFDDQKINLLCARAMTGAIVLFDHTDPLGVFRKKSPIATKECIVLLQSNFPGEVALQNSIQFSTKTFRDDTTPSSISNLFD
jgi:CYRIA/CYRIB Rac1 binding domain